jgi:hypothetical protein
MKFIRWFNDFWDTVIYKINFYLFYLEFFFYKKKKVSNHFFWQIYYVLILLVLLLSDSEPIVAILEGNCVSSFCRSSIIICKKKNVKKVKLHLYNLIYVNCKSIHKYLTLQRIDQNSINVTYKICNLHHYKLPCLLLD